MPDWRALQHPDLAPFVTHLTWRNRPPSDDLPDWITQSSAADRLGSILQSGTILGSRPYRTPTHVVCFTESTLGGIGHLIEERGYEPWGIVFAKEVVYSAGGGPVHYVRDDEWARYRESLPAEMVSRAVRFSPGEADWSHEREWRAPATGSPPSFEFDHASVHAIIVGDPGWPPDEVDDAYAVLDLGYDVMRPPYWARGLRRWWWDATNLRFAEVPGP
jgi:hypothetical protein